MLSARFLRLPRPTGITSKDCRDSTAAQSSDCSSPEHSKRYTKTVVQKHKTQLCKSYSELGHCRYGKKCRFAHGSQELKKVTINNENYRKRKCKGFWEDNECKYGIRCQFGHQERGWIDVAALAGLSSLVEVEDKQQSRLLRLLDL